jgi:hypothetical protein
MKTKTIILISAAAIVLSTTLAFQTSNKKATIAKEVNSTTSSDKSGGFALKE